MEELKGLIVAQKRRNVCDQDFVPSGALLDCMSETLIERVLETSSIERYRLPGLAQTVMNGATRTFAILVLIERPESIVSFYTDDQLQSVPIDHRLPLALDTLRSLLGEAKIAAQFFVMQWQLIAPVFGPSLLPRVLDDNIILPIVNREEGGEGGFAIARVVDIEPSHNSFRHYAIQRFVLKELRPTSLSRIDFERELRNLSILKLLKHRCIVELLACFTYRGTHNLLFPLAPGGTLHDLLYGKQQSLYEGPEEVYDALCGLASAVHAVHEFFAPEVEVIGCHHDLKPSNVLVDGKRLLLADFGLSRFKEPSQDSGSYFRGGRGDYVAPECENLQGDFDKHKVGRSSDIWALGCIIFETVVFTTEGVGGVLSFSAARSFKLDGVKYSRFHRGQESTNGEVQRRLQEMQVQKDPSVRLLGELIKDMLELDPKLRPRISEVNHRIRYIVINMFLLQVEAAFESFCKVHRGPVPIVERKRVSSWRWALEDLRKGNPAPQDILFSPDQYDDFKGIINALKELRVSLSTMQDIELAFLERDFLPLRKANDMLQQGSPSALRTSAQDRFEFDVILQWRELPTERVLLASSSLTSDTRELAGIKILNASVEAHDGIRADELLIKSSEVRELKLMHNYSIAEVNGAKVLLEKKPFNAYHRVEKTGQELSSRIAKIANLLSSSDILHVLGVYGYYIDMPNRMLGLAYKLPRVTPKLEEGRNANEETEVSNLHQIIFNDPRGKERPNLGDRFRLAHKLAHFVMSFHQVNWVQKGICAQNIIFFRPQSSLWKENMTEPYFIGFLYSRESSNASFSEGQWTGTVDRVYQHPQYVSTFERYLPRFDYYGLGIVLLEIAYWSSIHKIADSASLNITSAQVFYEWLIRAVVPTLGQKMGVLYETAVKECLSWTPAASEKDNTNCSPKECLRFKERVVDRLANCHA